MLSITINITSRRTHKGETDIHRIVRWFFDNWIRKPSVVYYVLMVTQFLYPHCLNSVGWFLFTTELKRFLSLNFALRFQNLTWAHSIKVNRKISNWGKIYYFYNILFWYNVITLVHCFLTLFLQTCHLAWDAHTLMWFTDWLGNSSPVREPQLNLVPNTPSFQL